jgi:hypothetical protein
MNDQAPKSILMIRPLQFGFNEQTAASNAFQSYGADMSSVQSNAVSEFDKMVDILRAHDIDVIVFNDNAGVPKPDAIFPNNWVSLHNDGTVILYPMMAENRRLERRLDILESLKKNFDIKQIIDLTAAETQGKYLEGTGSLVLDNVNKILYACRSPRTHDELISRVASILQFQPVVFNASDRSGKPIYHTNVMMCVGSKFAILCLDSITSEDDQEILLELFSKTGRQVIAISFDQMEAFAGNMLEVQTHRGEPVVIISSKAFHSLLPGQINAIQQHAELLPININTIEKCGGGSVRCMIAGIHLPKRKSI